VLFRLAVSLVPCRKEFLQFEVYFWAGISNTTPPFITKTTLSMARMSTSGSPVTATTSAYFPIFSVPIWSDVPRSLRITSLHHFNGDWNRQPKLA
jgi:hypothetical protein